MLVERGDRVSKAVASETTSITHACMKVESVTAVSNAASRILSVAAAALMPEAASSHYKVMSEMLWLHLRPQWHR